MHAKYEVSYSHCSKVMIKVKVDDRQDRNNILLNTQYGGIKMWYRQKSIALTIFYPNRDHESEHCGLVTETFCGRFKCKFDTHPPVKRPTSKMIIQLPSTSNIKEISFHVRSAICIMLPIETQGISVMLINSILINSVAAGPLFFGPAEQRYYRCFGAIN